MRVENYYEILGLDRELKGDMLDKKLIKIQRKWQSRTNAPSLEKRQQAETFLKLAIEAKEILTDSETRRKYDRQLAGERIDGEETRDIGVDYNLDDAIEQIREEIKNNNISNALLLAERASKEAPDNHQVISCLGYCYWKVGQLDKAIREYKTAIGLNPEIVEYYHNLINIYLENDDPTGAENYLKQARKLEPENDELLRIQALILNRRGQYKKTIGLIENIMEDRDLDRNNVVDRNILCDYVRAKQAEALSYYDKADDGYCYLTDLDKSNKAKEIWQEIEKYKFLYDNPAYVEGKLEEIDNLHKMKYKDGGVKLFIIPGIITISGIIWKLLGLAVAGLILLAGTVYFIFEPQWKINKSIVSGKESTLEHALSINSWILKIGIIGIIILAAVYVVLQILMIVLMFGLMMAFLSSSDDSY